MLFNVYSGEYPFDIQIGTIEAPDADKALELAVVRYSEDYPHPVIGPIEGVSFTGPGIH